MSDSSEDALLLPADQQNYTMLVHAEHLVFSHGIAGYILKLFGKGSPD